MAAPGKRALSARLVARQVSELTQARWLRWKALASHDDLSGIVLDVVLIAGIAHHPFRDPDTGRWIGLYDARVLRRPVTATAIAQSMRIPHTTVRRQAAALVDAALLVRGVGGFRIPEHFLIGDSAARIAAADAGDLMRGVQALATANYAPAAAAIDAGVAALPAGVVARLMAAFSLRAIETFTELHDDVATGTVMSAIIVANVRHITENPQLSQLYAGENAPPPDALRRPIAVRALARDIGMPFETIRRRVAALVAKDRVQWQDDGVIVPTRVLLSDQYRDNNRRIVLHFDQMLTMLAVLAKDISR